MRDPIVNGLTNTTTFGVQNTLSEDGNFDVSKTIIDKTAGATEYIIDVSTSHITGSGYIKFYVEHGDENSAMTVGIIIKNLKIYYSDKPTFNVNYEQISANSNKVTVSNIQYKENITNWQVKYKKSNEETWKTSNNLSFNVSKGIYDIKIVSGNIESKVKKIYVGDYIELEYIESTGNQYIDANVVPTLDTKMEIKLNSQYIEESAIFGSEWNLNGSFLMFYRNAIRWHSATAVDVPASLNSDYVIETGNGYLKVNNINYNCTPSTSLIQKSLMLYYTTGLNNIKGRFKTYYWKIYDGSTLVRDFIPVYSTADNSAGLYDKVENKFYGNNGDGKFIAGPEKANN